MRMRLHELKPAQMRALLLLLVLVPLIPGVLMLKSISSAVQLEKDFARQMNEDLYRQALRISQPSLQLHLAGVPAGNYPQAIQQFFERAFGGDVTLVVLRDQSVVAGRRPEPAREPVAIGALAGGYSLEVFGRPAADTAEGELNVLWRFAGSAIAVSLGIGALAALAVSRQLRLHEMEGTALATVAHEMKTPLASSRVLLETLLENRLNSEEKRRQYLELLRDENARLSRVAENFLVSGRLRRSAAEGERIEVGGLLAGAAGIVKISRPDEAHRLETAEMPGPVFVRGDREALLTALANLIENGLKFSPGTVRIRGERHGEEVRLTVSDDGLGIARKEQRRIFRRFYRVDRKLSRVTEGCGLGLSIVREIAESHGGRVTVQSAPARGSAFTISLPLAESPAS